MKIIIAGGGTAGWMTAMYLYTLNRFEIILIDKESPDRIGVGEATVLDFLPFMESCKLDVFEVLRETTGTLKSGIMFPGWKNINNEVWHPFFTCVTYYGTNIYDAWSNRQDKSFAESSLPMLENSLANKVDRENLHVYAVHIDCLKLVNYLKKKLTNRISMIDSDIVDVVKNNNEVEKLILSNGEEITADLYIDCTGFKSLLKPQKRVDISDRLFCNTAVAGHIPYQDIEKEAIPYVISQAVDHGWIWKIPVQDRYGSGLVFNRDITSIDEAKEYFVKHWDHRVSIDDLRVIDWTPYYCKNIWKENVVSIGLSGGFIEPLESTGLSLMIKGIGNLARKIYNGYFTEFDVNLYNTQMINIYEDAIDFVSMHYADTERNEPFWKYVRSKWKSSDRMEHYKALLASKDPLSKMQDYIQDSRMVSATNWLLWLIQLGYPVGQRELNNDPDLIFDLFSKAEKERIERSIPNVEMINFIKGYQR